MFESFSSEFDRPISFWPISVLSSPWSSSSPGIENRRYSAIQQVTNLANLRYTNMLLFFFPFVSQRKSANSICSEDFKSSLLGNQPRYRVGACKLFGGSTHLLCGPKRS